MFHNQQLLEGEKEMPKGCVAAVILEEENFNVYMGIKLVKKNLKSLQDVYDYSQTISNKNGITVLDKDENELFYSDILEELGR